MKGLYEDDFFEPVLGRYMRIIFPIFPTKNQQAKGLGAGAQHGAWGAPREFMRLTPESGGCP